MPLSVVKDGLYESKETKGIVVREFVPVEVLYYLSLATDLK